MNIQISSLVRSAVAAAVLVIASISPVAAYTDDNAVAQAEPANVLFADDAARVAGIVESEVADADSAVMLEAPPEALIEAPADVLAADATADVFADSLAEAAADAEADAAADAEAEATADATAKATKVQQAGRGVKRAAVAM